MRHRFGWRAVAFTVIGLGLGLLLVRESVAGVFRVAGPSDAPTLLWGEVVIVSRCAYDVRLPGVGQPVARIAEPARGDMILFRVPERGSLGLKRVVAVAGDRIQLRNHELWINDVRATYRSTGTSLAAPILERNTMGAWVGEEQILGQMHALTFTHGSETSDFGPVEVPAGHVFLLGDNRDNSFDSRSFGPLPRDQVLGRVMTNLSRRTGTMRPARS